MLICAPGPRESIEAAAGDATPRLIVGRSTTNVRGRAFVYSPSARGGWTAQPLRRCPTTPLSGIASGRSSRSDRALSRASTELPHARRPSGCVDAASGEPAHGQGLPAKFDASQRRGRAVRGDLQRRDQDPVFRRPPQGHEARRHQPHHALRLWRLPGLDDARPIRPTSASSGSSAAASMCWPTSAAAASSGPPGTRPGSRPTASVIYDDFAAVAQGPDRAQDHQPAPARAS